MPGREMAARRRSEERASVGKFEKESVYAEITDLPLVGSINLASIPPHSRSRRLPEPGGQSKLRWAKALSLLSDGRGVVSLKP